MFTNFMVCSGFCRGCSLNDPEIPTEKEEEKGRALLWLSHRLAGSQQQGRIGLL